jgi:probable addiction module antidote protein
LKLRKFDDYLYEKLRDPEHAIVYLETALEDGGIEDFLYALQEVAVAQGGVQKVAEESQRGRESLYKSLSKQGNPRIKTLNDILHALGMRIAVARVETAQTQRKQDQTAIHS